MNEQEIREKAAGFLEHQPGKSMTNSALAQVLGVKPSEVFEALAMAPHAFRTDGYDLPSRGHPLRWTLVDQDKQTHRITITYLNDPPPGNVLSFDITAEIAPGGKGLAKILRELVDQLESK